MASRKLITQMKHFLEFTKNFRFSLHNIQLLINCFLFDFVQQQNNAFWVCVLFENLYADKFKIISFNTFFFIFAKYYI